jgi:hypothetical protein
MISLFNRENTGKFSKFEENLIIVYAKRQGQSDRWDSFPKFRTGNLARITGNT